MMKLIGTDPEPIEILLVEDSPGDVRLTREAFKDAKYRPLFPLACGQKVYGPILTWTCMTHARNCFTPKKSSSDSRKSSEGI